MFQQFKRVSSAASRTMDEQSKASDCGPSGASVSGKCCFRDVEYFCNTCKKKFCSICVVDNHKMADLLKHEISRMETANKKTGGAICEKHSMAFQLFCLDHTCNCCAKCVAQGHRGCDERLLSLDQGYASCLEEIFTDASALAKQYEKQMDKINEQSKVIPGQIESMKECVLKLFDELRLRVTGTINDKENEVKEEIKPKRQFCNDTKSDIDMTSSILKEKGTITSSNKLLPVLANKLQSYKNSIAEQKMLNFDVEMSIKFNDSVETITNTRSVGDIKIAKRYPQKKIHLRKIDGRVLGKSSNDDSEPRYCKLEFVNDMQIVAIDSMNRKVVLLSSKLEIQSTLMLNNCIPFSLAVISKGTAAVTSISDKIDILQIGGNNTITLNQPLNVSSQYSSATKINDETMCCIAKGDNRSMRMVSLNGKETDFFPKLPEKAYKPGEAEIAFIKTNQTLVITEKYNNVVIFYDVRGKQSPVRITHEDLIYPRGISVGSNDCIYVCSETKSSILQISPDAKVVGTNKIEMTCPSAVSVSPNSRFLVVANDTKSKRALHIYSVE